MVTSADGTRLALHTIGAGPGPGLVIVHGSMQSGPSQLELGRLLAHTHTVHLVDRRGRGGSAPADGTATEVADLRAVLAETGANDVLGISSGAIIAARTALATGDLHRLALFEPPLALDDSLRLDLVPALFAALDADDVPRAMALGMRIAEMGPPWMFRLPTAVLAGVSRRMLARDDRATPSAGRARLRELAHALRADFTVVTENAMRVADFAAITAPTLLLSGTATRPYLRAATAALAGVIPGARHVELPGLYHSATQDRAERGRPELVAPVLRAFFAV